MVRSVSTVDWDGESVVTTCMTIAELLSTGTIFLHLFWQLGDPFHPNFGFFVSYIWPGHDHLLLHGLVLRILATLPRGNPSSLTPAVSLTINSFGLFLNLCTSAVICKHYLCWILSLNIILLRYMHIILGQLLTRFYSPVAQW